LTAGQNTRYDWEAVSKFVGDTSSPGVKTEMPSHPNGKNRWKLITVSFLMEIVLGLLYARLVSTFGSSMPHQSLPRSRL
jgi:hypothetical protein